MDGLTSGIRHGGPLIDLRRTGHLTLRFYLGILILVSLGTAAVCVAVGGAQARSDARRAAEEATAYAAGQAADRIREDVAVIGDTAASTAAIPDLSQTFTEPGCSLTFGGAGAFAGGHIDVVRPDGSVACSSNPDSVSHAPVYARTGWFASASDELALKAPVVDPTTGEQSLISAAPIEGGGFVVVSAGLDSVGPSLTALYGGPGGLEFLVVTAQGDRVLARSIDPATWTGSTLQGTPFLGSNQGTDGVDVDGTRRLYSDRLVEGVGWTVYAGADVERAMGAADRLNRKQLAILLIGLTVVLLVTLVVYRQIVRPIRRLSLGVRAAATRPDPTVMSVRGPAEVSHLAGEINGLLAAVDRDVSERYRTANQELQAFSSSVSHDLRAPLGAINWFASILDEDHGSELSADGHKQLARIKESTAKMSDLIDALLEFSRLGRGSVQKETIEPGVLVREALEFVGPDQTGRNIDFSIDELPSCHADPRLLRIVFVNLISNAVKYTRGCAVARIHIGSVSLEGRTTYFVRDNGAGFDMKYAGNLFSVFERLHRAEDYEGTGVGLATTHRVIERHGGRIWAEAEPDRGATFFFTVEPATRDATRWRELGISQEAVAVN